MSEPAARTARAGGGRRWPPAPLVLIGAVLVVTAVAYSRAPSLPLVWDDHQLIEESSLLGDPARVGSIFTSDLFATAGGEEARLRSEYFRPLTTLTFWIDARFGAHAPTAGHLFNLLLHLLNIGLAFVLCRRLGFEPLAAAAVAAFFGLNPLQTETVYWISARGGLLAGALVLAAGRANLAVQRPWLRSALVGIGALAALAAKETALAALPFVVLAPLAVTPAPRWRRLLGPAIGVALAVAGYLAWRQAVGVFNPGDAGLTLGLPLLVDFLSVVERLTAWILVPFGLSACHDYAPSAGGALALTAFLLTGSAFLAVLAWRKGERLAGIALLWLGSTALLVGAAIGGIEVIAERYAYLPVLALALLAASLGRRFVAHRGGALAARAGVILALLVAGLFAVTVFTRAAAWHSERALFGAALEATGSSEAARLLASYEAHRHQNWPVAAELYRVRVEQRPDDARSWNNLAACLIELRRFDGAAQAARQARKLEPDRHSAWLNEATALVMLDEPSRANELLDRYVATHGRGVDGDASVPRRERYLEIRSLATARGAADNQPGKGAP